MKTKQNLPQLLYRLWFHISPRRRLQFGVLTFLMISASLAEVVSIGAVLPFLGVLTAPERVFDHHLTQPAIQWLKLTKPNQLILPLTIAFAVTALFAGVMRVILLWAQTRISHAIGADFSISMYRRTLYQSYAVHVMRNSSDVISGITNKSNNLVHSVILPVLIILSSATMLLTILFALIAIDPTVAWTASFGFGAIYLVVMFFTKSRLARDSRRVSLEENQVIKALQEGLGGIRDVLIDGTQAIYCKIYRDADLPLRRAQANIQIIGASPRFCIEAIGMVFIALLAYSMVGRSGGISNVIPVLGAFALGAQRLLPVLQQAYSSWAAMSGGRASFRDALDLLEQPLPEHADAPFSEPITFLKNISLNNVTFCYTPNGPSILQGLELKIKKGECIGFVGRTGSGKSTLLDIIMGLLNPVEGNLVIDDVIVTSQNQRAWQMRIAHVPQTIFLADATVAENIAFGVSPSQIDFGLVRRAAKKAQIDQTIESWDDKYNTSVGEKGVRLSGGQRQRIGIARALYKDADVIVFDEATSALDNETEHAVMQAISNLRNELTILIVAHRLTTLKNCDKIVELSGGRVKRIVPYRDIESQIN